MSVGYGATLTVSGLNNQLGDLAVRARNLAAEIIALQQETISQGQAGMVALGFSGDPTVTSETDPAAGDAGLFRYKTDLLGTWAQVFMGQAGQADPFDFNNAVADVCGPRIR
jgi:hypothetical protein